MEKNEILEKKLQTSWGDSTREQDVKNNFAVETELTVTITLNEYRNLLRDLATSAYKYKELESKKDSLYNENQKLKEKVNSLNETIKNLVNPSQEEPESEQD